MIQTLHVHDLDLMDLLADLRIAVSYVDAMKANSEEYLSDSCTPQKATPLYLKNPHAQLRGAPQPATRSTSFAGHQKPRPPPVKPRTKIGISSLSRNPNNKVCSEPELLHVSNCTAFVNIFRVVLNRNLFISDMIHLNLNRMAEGNELVFTSVQMMLRYDSLPEVSRLSVLDCPYKRNCPLLTSVGKVAMRSNVVQLHRSTSGKRKRQFGLVGLRRCSRWGAAQILTA